MSSSETKIEPLHVVDTHALAWYLTANSKLGSDAANVFRAADDGETRLVISAIVLAELFFVDQKWEYFDDFTETYRDITTHPAMRVEPVNPKDILDFERDKVIPEMHDRIIVGLARRLRAPLVTKDKPIRDAGLVTVVW